MIKAMMLFGSAARGDTSTQSDTDMLAIVDDLPVHSLKKEMLEIQFLPTSELFSMASRGDLFAIHLALEGQVIFDKSQIFAKFKEKISIREDYSDIRSSATDLAFFLYEFGPKFRNQTLVNKRIAWCVRTILISLIVEKKRFIFSPSGLMEAFPYEHVSYLIDLRRSSNANELRFKYLKKFLTQFAEKPLPRMKLDEYEEIFASHKNAVAISTFNTLTKKSTNSNSEYI